VSIKSVSILYISETVYLKFLSWALPEAPPSEKATSLIASRND